MAIGSNKSKFNGKKAASASHSLRDTADCADFELPSSLFDNPVALLKALFLQPAPSGKKKEAKDDDEDEDEIEEEKPRESKEEREKRKKTVEIGTENGVGFSHRKMTKKEKKCLEKGKKKMKKSEHREKDQDIEHKEIKETPLCSSEVSLKQKPDSFSMPRFRYSSSIKK
jgi:hypothetical protein